MKERAWIQITLVVACLLILPGCHVLVRLGEQHCERQLFDSVDAEDEQRIERRSAPSSGPETPPLPGLVPQEDTPPVPGLGTDNTDSEPSRSRIDLDSVRRRISGNTGINTNTAIAPGEGQFVYRTQLRFLESHSSPGPAHADVNILVNPQILAYGVKENFTLFGVVPLVKRDATVHPPMPAGAVRELDDFGMGDIRFFGKYRFWEQDSPGETTRWSVFGGVEVPTYDKDFSSDSFDPFLGTVWTYQSLDWGLDLDLFWNFNTGKGTFRHDEMRYDLAYTYVLLTGQTLDEKFWQLNSVFELNGSYLVDGSNLLFAAPGFQLALERMIVEASLQLPIIRDLKSTLEPDFVFVIGTRITW